MKKIKWAVLNTLVEYKRIAKEFNEYLANSGYEVELIIVDQDPKNPLQEIDNGDLDIYQIPSSQLLALTEKPWLKVWEFPFIFRSNEHVESYINSDHTKLRIKELETDTILPLTYSYAGGFCYVVKEKSKTVHLYNEIPLIQEENFIDHVNAGAAMPLPHAILAYEVAGYTELDDEMKKRIEVEISNHMVISRITFISKKLALELGPEAIAKLTDLLNQERQAIYGFASARLPELLEDGILKYHYVPEDEKDQYRKNLVSNNRDLNHEISFVQTLSYQESK